MLATAVPAYATTAPIDYQYQRLFYYREGPNAKLSLMSHASSIDILAPQTYALSASGILSGSVAKDVLDFAKLHHIKVMPLVTNASFSRTAAHALLTDTRAQTSAITAMVLEARDRGFAGWQFDFEQVDATDRVAYTAFIHRAYTAFKAKGLTTSVAVIAKISDNPSDYKAGLWDNLIGVFDYSALAKYTDFISIMSYDAPDSTGPIAPFPWYEKVTTYALAHIPNNKISLGIPTYYWQRSDATGKIVGIGGVTGINNVFAKYRPTVTYDSTQEAPALHYTGASNMRYTLWYENARSVAAKVAVVTDNHLQGVSLWVLGLELPSIYDSLKR